MLTEETTIPGTWYTITCTAPATVTENIGDEPVTLATLDDNGLTHFRASGSRITISTEGTYRILPFA